MSSFNDSQDLAQADALSQGGLSYDDSKYGGRSVRSRYTASRTGGAIELPNLNAQDVSGEERYVPDEFNKMDFERRQISETKCTSQRFVESLVTGEFQEVRKDFDPNAVADMSKYD